MKRILTLAAAAALLLSLPACSALDFLANAAKQGSGKGGSVQVSGMRDLRIAIDAGHGGVDNGASGEDSGVLECDLNLAVARILADKFRQAGADVLMTRDSADVDYSGEGDTQKLRDMNNRIALVKGQGSNVLVSIHMNTFSDRKVAGAQVFHQQDSEDGEAFARCIQEALNAGVNAKNGRHVGSGEYYLLKGVECPSVIVECGFLSNPEDEKNLQDEEYQKKLADCIYKGVCDYLGIQ